MLLTICRKAHHRARSGSPIAKPNTLPRYTWRMRNEFTAIVERDGAWYIAYCAEVPGANGQGRTREECLQSLRSAISLILDHRREDSLRSLPPEAERELVVVG